MNTFIDQNFSKLKPTVFLLPIVLVIVFLTVLYYCNALTVTGYLSLQLDLFYKINQELSQMPVLQNNLTQFGDAFVILSLFTFFIVHASKLWEVLITSNIISAILCKFFKTFFCVPRPASFLNQSTFTIIGHPHIGKTSSLPSGHSITIFTVVTVLIYALLPKEKRFNFFWFLGLISFGLIVAFSRVGVGAHFPLDVLAGSLIGYFSGLLGIFFSRKYSLWPEILQRYIYIFFLILILGSIIFMFIKLLKENLFVYYLSIFNLFYSLYAIIISYFREKV